MACLIKPQFEAGREKVGKRASSVTRQYTWKCWRASCVMQRKITLQFLVYIFSYPRSGRNIVIPRLPEKGRGCGAASLICGRGGRLTFCVEGRSWGDMKRVILCPNPYRDSELTVAKRSREPAGGARF